MKHKDQSVFPGDQWVTYAVYLISSNHNYLVPSCEPMCSPNTAVIIGVIYFFYYCIFSLGKLVH